MNPGKLNARLSIYAPTFEPNDAGQEIPTYSYVQKCWAEVKVLKASEILQYQTEHEQTLLSVTLQRGLGITAKYKLTHGTRTYQVVAVPDNDDTSLFVTLVCCETKPV